jgi:hypothetical protein
MVMKPPIATSLAGVKTKTGFGSAPVMELPRVMDATVTMVPIKGAAFAIIPASVDVDKVKYPAARAVPRLRPAIVTVTAAVPVAAPVMVMTIEVEAEVAALALVPAMLVTVDLPEAKVPVPVK